MLITGMPLVMWSVDWKSNVHEKGRVSSWKSRPDGRATCFDFIILSWLLSFPEWRYRPQFPSISRRPTSLSTLPLPRVINFKFPLQPPQNYITSHGIRTLLLIAYSDEKWLYSTTDSLYLTHTFLLKSLGGCTFWTWKWKCWLIFVTK